MGLPKGYMIAATYSSKKRASEKAESIRHKFNSVIVKRGTKGATWGNKRTVYRVLVK